MKKIALIILLLVLTMGLAGCPWWHHGGHGGYHGGGHGGSHYGSGR
jgi:hypothetical protein